MSFKENMTQAILNLTEEGEGATNSTQALTQTAVGYLNNAQGVIRREMKDNYLKGKFVGGDGIVESKADVLKTIEVDKNHDGTFTIYAPGYEIGKTVKTVAEVEKWKAWYVSKHPNGVRKTNHNFNLSGKHVLNEATLVLGSYTAVLQRSGIDFALYISDMRVELYYDTKVVGRGKGAYIDMCFDEDVRDQLLAAARKAKADGTTDTKAIEALLKKYALEGTKVVSVKINKVGV